MTTPPIFENARYEEVPEGIRALFDRIRETRRGLYIHGGVGVGKTHIAYALKHRFSETGPVVLWNTTELLRAIRDDYDRKPKDREKHEKGLMETRALLILDDIGAERITDANASWLMETFYLIVNRRYEERRPIIFTSNLPVFELASRVGDRVASRIVEMCDIVEVAGSDRRMEKAAKIQVGSTAP